ISSEGGLMKTSGGTPRLTDDAISIRAPTRPIRVAKSKGTPVLMLGYNQKAGWESSDQVLINRYWCCLLAFTVVLSRRHSGEDRTPRVSGRALPRPHRR